MIRKFNYTGRKKLKHARINIILNEDASYKSFIATIDLIGLGLPDDAKIYIEPYHKSSFMRFEFGTVSNIVKPLNTFLTDIPSTSIVRFRIKIVDESNKLGRIIGLADKIKPWNLEGKNSNRTSILHIDWDKDLDQEIFRISFPENDFPRLEINKRIDNARDLIKNDQLFRSLVFPVAIKEAVTKIAFSLEDFEDGDDSWQSAWLRFIRETLHVNIEIDEDKEIDEISHWIEETVSAFCRKNKCRSRFEQTIK